jgi:hypothetical protein
VVGRIEEQDDGLTELVVERSRAVLRVGLDERLVEIGVALVVAERRVADDGRGVGVPAEHVDTHRRVVHGLVLAQQMEELVRVLAELGCERDAEEVECLLGRLCHRIPP